MNILLIDDEEDIRQIFEFCLMSVKKVTCIEASSGNEAISIIKAKKDEIDLIICDFNMGDGNGEDVYRYLLDNNIDIPYVLASSHHPSKFKIFDNQCLLFFNFLKPEITPHIEEMFLAYDKLKNKRHDAVEQNQDYLPLNIHFINKIGAAPCDLFIKVSETNMVKIHKEGDLFDEKEKYKQKKITHLYIDKKDVSKIFSFITNSLQEMFENKNLSSEDKINSFYQFLGSTVRQFPFTEDYQKVTGTVLGYITEIMKKDPPEKLLNLANGSNYNTGHSLIISLFSIQIAKELNLTDKSIEKKMTVASLLHDISISDLCDDERIYNNLVIEEKHTREVNLAKIKTHPIDSAKFATTLKDMPPDIDKIIAEHHELPGGRGFPRKLTEKQISQLSAIFIVAHHITECLYDLREKKEEIKWSSILEKTTSEKFFGSHFKRILEILPNLEPFA